MAAGSFEHPTSRLASDNLFLIVPQQVASIETHLGLGSVQSGVSITLEHGLGYSGISVAERPFTAVIASVAFGAIEWGEVSAPDKHGGVAGAIGGIACAAETKSGEQGLSNDMAFVSR